MPATQRSAARGHVSGTMTLAGFLAVGVGAALGAWLRGGSVSPSTRCSPTLPYGTLAANLTGGYLVGVAVAYFGHHTGLPPEMRLFAITGFLGELTTFSTFSAEVVSLASRPGAVRLGLGRGLGAPLRITLRDRIVTVNLLRRVWV